MKIIDIIGNSTKIMLNLCTRPTTVFVAKRQIQISNIYLVLAWIAGLCPNDPSNGSIICLQASGGKRLSATIFNIKACLLVKKLKPKTFDSKPNSRVCFLSW